MSVSVITEEGTFGQIMKQKREETGFTRREVARFCGITDAYLGMIENGSRRCSSKVKRKLHELYELDAEMFASDVGRRLRAQARIYRMLMFYVRRSITKHKDVYDFYMIDVTGRNLILTSTTLFISNTDPHSNIRELSFSYSEISFDTAHIDDEQTIQEEMLDHVNA